MAEDEFKLDTNLAFTLEQQAAVVGWCLRETLFCKQCVTAGVRPAWFSSPNVGKVYDAVTTLFREHHRVPRPEEVKEYRPFTMEDARSKQALDDALVECLKKSQRFGVDILRADMTNWMQAVIFAQGMEQAVNLYNAAAKAGPQKVREAWKLVGEIDLLQRTSTFEDGAAQGFLPSADRIVSEREVRLAQRGKLLKYGAKFLNDALIAISPNDLVLLGAETGAGKTQLAVATALENAAPSPEGLGVHYFALEAEESEVERRIKYGLIAGEYYRRRGNDPDAPLIDYGNWRMGLIDDLLGPLEKELEPQLRDSVRGLHTLYRTSGKFGMDALERHLLEVVNRSRLIVLDHLHYVDVDDDNDENRAYKRVIKLIRDLVLRYSVPVMVVAHLRKKQGKSASVMPTVQEFHGTSDVPKIATTAIMLAPAWDHAAAHPYLLPTYLGCTKSRLDGSRTRWTGLCNFDARTSRYEDEYRIGKVVSGEWEQQFVSLPRWAQVPDLRTKHSL